MWLDGQPSDLQPLMALKGMRKADQQVRTMTYDTRKLIEIKITRVKYGIKYYTT